MNGVGMSKLARAYGKIQGLKGQRLPTNKLPQSLRDARVSR